MTDIPGISELEAKLGYHFRDPSLLERALTHGSLVGKTQEPVKRMAWLGDAMLVAIASQELHESLGAVAKEILHTRREEVRTNEAVACAARAIELERYITIGESLKRNDKATTRDQMLATHLEAVIGPRTSTASSMRRGTSFAQSSGPHWSTPNVTFQNPKS